MITGADHVRIDGCMAPGWLTPAARQVCQHLTDAGYLAYVTGGAVRDGLLAMAPKDMDIVTSASVPALLALFPEAQKVEHHFTIVMLRLHDEVLEIATLRGPGTVAGDAVRRDFTVNALYYEPATGALIDHHNGMADLRRRQIRTIGDPVLRFRDDPMRMLRAVRLASTLAGWIDPAAQVAMSALAPLLVQVSAGRLLAEISRQLGCGKATACLGQLVHFGLHADLLPRLAHDLAPDTGSAFLRVTLDALDQSAGRSGPMSPELLFALLLWPQVAEQWQRACTRGEEPAAAMRLAAQRTLDAQSASLKLREKMGGALLTIWLTQPYLEGRAGATAQQIMQHPRFRAGYSLLKLRCAAGELDTTHGQRWHALLADAAA